ncbi:MAG: hypothetical protein B6226_00805 [Candidatus Cloacimonetes bacterium 4572_65]|nr:MAG: hypothetical protein B6226_00805 [Candidatus Cloacimonetes bacterium 4572_65]
MKVLFLCTGNSCRSQIAEGFLAQIENFESFSAGTKPASQVNPNAISVMQEIGIDISANKPKLVSQFIDQEFDIVVTVCDSAKENCPVFTGKVTNRIHRSFEDPDGFGIEKFREVRDLIKVFIDNLVEDL